MAHIAPLVVRSEAEQRRFWEQRENYAKLLGKPLTGDAPQTEAREEKEKEAKGREEAPPKIRRYLLLSLLLALVLAAIFWPRLRPEAPLPAEAQPAPIDTTNLIRGCRDTAALNFDPQATADCDDCCIYEIVGCRNPKAPNYNPNATIDCEDCCEKTRSSVANFVQRDSVSWRPTPPIYEYTEPAPLTPIGQSGLLWLARYKTLLSWLIPILLLSFSLGWLLWRRARRDYLARQSRSDEPPYRLPIKIRRDRELELDERFFFLLDRLRGREAGERLRIDIPATIKATARRGGFPELRFRPYSRPTDYLILIDKQAEYNHQSQLFEYIYQRFVKQEVYAERFFFDGDPRWCWNDRHPGGLPLEQVLQRHGQARLLVFADGHSFLNPATGALEDWVKVLEGWNQRALLTPAPAGAWNYREGRLSESFLILPSSIEGMLQLVRHFETLSTPSLREWKYELEAGDQPVHIDEGKVVTDLQRQLSPDLLRWVAACAVYPELHWDLSLEIGETLRPDNRSVRFGEVRQLARLPWFREGYMPQDVRRQLLEAGLLSATDEQRVRAAIVRILAANAPENTNSYAYEEHQLHLAINQLLLSRLPEERRRWLQRYRELHGRGLREDMVSMAALDRRYNRRLDFLLPKPLVQQLFAGGRRVLGWRSAVPLLLSLLIGLGAWGLVRLLPEPCANLVTLPGDENEYCLGSRTDSLKYYAELARIALGSGRPELATAYVDTVLQWPADTSRRRMMIENFADPLLGMAWTMGRGQFLAANFHGAAARFADVDRWATRMAQEGLVDGPGTQLNAYTRREWLGLAQFFAGERAIADSLAALLTTLADRPPPSYPDLATYLRYPYVDSTTHGRIRVRTEGGRYSFLQADTGLPTWTGAQAPYDHAFRYQRDSLSGDTLALITTGTQQCFVGLDERIDPDNCFTRLVRFQDPRTDRYGYENERGTVIIPARFASAGDFTDDDLAWVQRPGEGFGYIRKDGSDLLPRNDLTAARDFRRGLAAVQRNGLWGYLNTNGAMAIPTQFETAGDFNANGQARVSKNGRQYTINENGDCVGGDCPVTRYRGRILGEVAGRNTPQPLPGVRLTVPGLPPLETDAQGYYEFTLPEGESPAGRTVTTQAFGYRAASFNFQIAEANADPVELAPYDQLPLLPPEAPPDADNDGTPDANDRCPDQPGPEELRGCPDGDGDGIADIDDRCKDEAGPADNQGCPPTEVDPIAQIAANMVQVAGGTFTMGCLDGRDTDCLDREKPAHDVTVSAFSISKYEVTQAQWRAVMGSDPSSNSGCDDCPVEQVSWNDVQEFLQKLRAQTGQNYRLPTEAEWEFAARGGNRSRGYLYSGGDDIDEVAWYSENYSTGNTHGARKTTRPVGGKAPNELDLYDMSGNVYEWCSDWYDDYPSKKQVDPQGPKRGSDRVFRGGGWGHDPQDCRAAYRAYWYPTGRNGVVGFRLARS